MSARPLQALAALLLAALAGCNAAPPRVAAGDACTATLARVDAQVAAAGLRDGGPRPVPGAPALRVDRALASLLPAPGDVRFAAWARRARELDRVAREAEMRNLGLDAERRAQVQRCADAGLASLLADPGARAAVARAAAVPDDYSLALRAAGLYPLASVAMLAAIERLQRRLHEDFRVPLEALPVRGRLVRFVPPGDAGGAPGRSGDAAPPEGASRAPAPASTRDPTPLPEDALGLPAPGRERLEALFRRHAPVFEVDVAHPHDRIGRVFLDGSAEPAVDPAQPVVYRRHGFTRLGGRLRLQLEYLVWFGSRPSSGPLDVLAGALDGLVWRVTLDERGDALAYDSIHPCGCYHQVIPGERLALREPPPRRYEEPLLSPQRAPPPGPGRVVVRVAHRSHYLQRVYRDPAAGGIAYGWDGYDALRSLALPGGGRRSLFRPDGLVPASVRPERWLLWMAGVESPGAMRQAGRHAVAFVGRRHFDDPDLLERFFRLRPR